MIIVGGGVVGVAAAVPAVRNVAKTALVEKNGVLYGLAVGTATAMCAK